MIICGIESYQNGDNVFKGITKEMEDEPMMDL